MYRESNHLAGCVMSTHDKPYQQWSKAPHECKSLFIRIESLFSVPSRLGLEMDNAGEHEAYSAG